FFCFFFFNDTATTEISTLSLHDALPILGEIRSSLENTDSGNSDLGGRRIIRSEEHTSELQSRPHLVCRLLLEKNKTQPRKSTPSSDIRQPGAPTAPRVDDGAERLPRPCFFKGRKPRILTPFSQTGSPDL